MNNQLKSRRDFLTVMGATLATIPVGRYLAGCAADTAAAVNELDAGALADAATAADASVGADATFALSDWATGGTAVMAPLSSYPDPFTAFSGTTCTMQCNTTIGPCHADTVEKEDLSDGIDGLPVVLAFRVLDSDCKPVAGALVEVWYTDSEGVYSDKSTDMCNKATSAQRTKSFSRGYRLTDADGKVFMKSTFPGWYSGRVIHYHVRVMLDGYVKHNSGDSSTNGNNTTANGVIAITQFVFAEELVSAICTTEPLYKDRGTPDTKLANDNVMSGFSDKSPYILDVQKATDKVMIASKTLIVRADRNASICGDSGGGGGGQPPR